MPNFPEGNEENQGIDGKEESQLDATITIY